MYKTLIIFLLVSSNLLAQKFIDRSQELGFDIAGVNRGVSIGDFNNDGYEDIYLCRKDGPNLLYQNLGDFNFTEVGSEKKVAYEGATSASLWIDIDNDGDLDLFLANSFEPCKVYRNDGAIFSDITTEVIPITIGNIQSANAVDFDNDGDIDIYLARFLAENILFRNEDGQYFVDYLQPSGITDVGQSMGAVFFDYDNDGDQDLYQTRDGNAGNLFFRNDGGYFTELTEQTNTGYKGQGMGVDIADVDHDGLYDIYFTNLYENVLLIQKPDHTFEQYNNPLIQDEGMGWGTLFFDSNNDTKKDLFLANDSHFVVNATNHPNKLMLNRGDMTFFSPTMNADFQNTHASYGAAFADFDRDGRLDLVVCNAGSDGNQIFHNQSVDKNYLTIKLKGTQSNIQAIGAKVDLVIEDERYSSVITAGHSYASQSSSHLHFGLADIDAIDSLIVQWPSGEVQVILDVDINQQLEIIEPHFSPGTVVWTEPAFPTQNDDITLYFDAKEGNGGLEGFSGDVFMHAGVITTNSNSPTDWKFVQGTWGVPDDKVKMIAEGDDIYSKSYNITDFYGIPAGEVVEQLAFVFRSGNGSQAGRAADGSDIYLDVYPPGTGLLVDLVSPKNDNTIVFEGELVNVILNLNKEASVVITDDGIEIYNASAIEHSVPITASGLGTHALSIVVNDGIEQVELSRKYFVLDATETQADAPAESTNGLNYRTGSYLFKLTAPEKKHVFLLCPSNDYAVDLNYKMTKSLDGSYYWIEVPRSVFSSPDYSYQYLVDGEIKIADPFSTIVLDPSNDSGIPEDVKEVLPPYPTVMTTGIVTAFEGEESNFAWTSDAFVKPEKTDLVIYEIMMRDFLEDKNYKSLLDTLDYLKDLGITAIELMPISEFEGNQSWGYNPSFHMAVDKYYGSPDQLKAVIDACHQRGIAVILDVVFNHAFSQSPLCQLYWNPAEFRPAPGSPYLNETAKHPYNVGYDFNHESSYTKQWVKQVLSYWMQEFRFDGFRFDLSKGLTQTFSGNNGSVMSRYDQSRIDILKDYSDHIWAIDSDAYVIMEHFADNDEETELANYGMMLWGNMTHDFAEAAMGYRSDLEWADYTVRGWNDPHLIAYMESHDEERMGYKLRQSGDATGNYNTRELATGMDRIAAASAIYFSIPGPKMLWQFGELGYDESINRCVNGSISSNHRLDPKPIRWEYFQNEHRSNLYDKISAMLHLRANYPVFATEDFVFSDGNFFLKTVHLNAADMNVVTMANFRTTNSDLNPKFPYPGTWHEYFSGAELEVENTQEKLTFAPGEYRIYLSERIAPPEGYFTSTTNVNESSIDAYPNPVRAGEYINIDLPEELAVSDLELINLEGRRISVPYDKVSRELRLELPELEAGIYFINLKAGRKFHKTKLVVLP